MAAGKPDLNDFLDTLVGNFEAAGREKRAAAMHDSTTSHPINNVPDGQQEATQGSRSAENASDVNGFVPGDNCATEKNDATAVPDKKPVDSIGTETLDPGETGGNAPSSQEAAATKEPPPTDSPSHPTTSLFTSKAAADLSNVAGQLLAKLTVDLQKTAGETGEATGEMAGGETVSDAPPAKSAPDTSPTANASDAENATPEGAAAAKVASGDETQKPQEEVDEEEAEKVAAMQKYAADTVLGYNLAQQAYTDLGLDDPEFAKKAALVEQHGDAALAGYEAAKQAATELGHIPDPNEEAVQAHLQKIAEAAIQDANRLCDYHDGFAKRASEEAANTRHEQIKGLIRTAIQKKAGLGGGVPPEVLAAAAPMAEAEGLASETPAEGGEGEGNEELVDALSDILASEDVSEEELEAALDEVMAEEGEPQGGEVAAM